MVHRYNVLTPALSMRAAQHLLSFRSFNASTNITHPVSPLSAIINLNIACHDLLLAPLDNMGVGGPAASGGADAVTRAPRAVPAASGDAGAATRERRAVPAASALRRRGGEEHHSRREEKDVVEPARCCGGSSKEKCVLDPARRMRASWPRQGEGHYGRSEEKGVADPEMRRV
jgi:hypothetical protein